MAALKFFKTPPISAIGFRRLNQAAESAPPFDFGESHSDAVKALQQALIALFDPGISIPSGPTGNYLHETQAAVRAFQQKFHLFVDGVAGRDTIRVLDAELDRRSYQVLQRLDRCIDGCRPSWYRDAYRLQILHQLDVELRNLKATNVLGFAAAAVPLVLLVLLVFAVMMFCATPQYQAGLRQLMSEVMDAVRARGEVAQSKIEELGQKIRSYIRTLTDIRSDCEKKKEQSEPDKYRDCRRLHALATQAAFEALIKTLDAIVIPILIGLEGIRTRHSLAGKDLFVVLSDAFKNYLNALNDYFKCLQCPEIPFPFFPDFPDFP